METTIRIVDVSHSTCQVFGPQPKCARCRRDELTEWYEIMLDMGPTTFFINTCALCYISYFQTLDPFSSHSKSSTDRYIVQ